MKDARTLHYSSFNTPMGTFSVAVGPGGEVAAAVFGEPGSLRARLPGAEALPDAARTAAARRQLEEWFGGARREFSVAVSPAGTPFQRRVWDALRAIPFGETRSYADVARAVGSSARAVGRANAANPICVIVPCHRVVGSDGSLTGYAFGLDTKRRLLEFEAAGAPKGQPPGALRAAETNALSLA
jgi:methylated-DNA-[protein]-cysteine S-methyltransferase